MTAASPPTPVHARPLAPAAPNRRPARLGLWLPLTPLFLLLAPFALLFAPLAWLSLPVAARPGNPYAAALAIGRVLLSLGGTVVAVDAPAARLFIRIF